jgi:dihydropteroate synthase
VDHWVGRLAVSQLGNAAGSKAAAGSPVLVGASRKRFLGTLLAGGDGTPRPPDGRETATAVISALAGLHGAWGVRVHDVRASVDALKVLDAWQNDLEETHD